MTMRGGDRTRYLVPLVLGVTGHRILPGDGPDLVALVSGALEALRSRFPATPLVVLSPLAEGADRLAARVAMERFGGRLVAPLPFPPEEYRQDFAQEASRREFDELLARAARWHVVPGGGAAGSPDRTRTRQYARVGAYIVEQAHALLAVWDEAEARGPGGTAQVVSWWRSGQVPPGLSSRAGESQLLAPADPRLLVVVNPLRGTVALTPAADGEGRTTWAALERLEAFNRDVTAQLRQRGEADLRDTEARLLGSLSRGTSGPDGPARSEATPAAPRYASADVLAVRLQGRERSIVTAIHAIFAVALLLYGMIDWLPLLVAFHVVSIPVVALLVSRTRRERLQDRWLDYRALAEALRVLVFWRLAGIPARVSDSYLSRHAGVVSWIRQAVTAVEVLDGAEPGPPAVQGPGSPDVIGRWVEGQRAYFSSRRASCLRRSRQSGRIVGAAFALTCAVAGLYSVYAWGEYAAGPGGLLREARRRLDAAGLGDDYFQGTLGVFGAVAVATEAYRKRRAFDELARQYALAEQLFAAARRRLDEGSWPVPTVLLALGREALVENGEWLWMNRAQPLELPKG